MTTGLVRREKKALVSSPSGEIPKSTNYRYHISHRAANLPHQTAQFCSSRQFNKCLFNWVLSTVTQRRSRERNNDVSHYRRTYHCSSPGARLGRPDEAG